MSNVTVKLSGLTCAACEKLVTKYLSKINSVYSVEPLGDKRTFVIGSLNKLTQEQIEAALKNTSYAVLSIA